MSEYYTDKNGFTARVGEDWNDEKSDQTLAYLTSPRTKFSKEEATKNLNPIGNRIVQYSNIAKAPSSIQQYHEKKLLEKNKPIKKVVPKKIEVQKPDPIISDPITEEDTYKQKLLDEPTWEQIKQGFKDKAAAAVKADEEAARKQGGIVWLNWRNPII